MTERIAIGGVPKSGKTTLAARMGKERGVVVWHTDDLISLGWSEASQATSEWFDNLEVRIIEGVAVPRALRKWLKQNDEGKPVDRVIFLSEPRVLLTLGQQRMAKGCRTVWLQIVDELQERGVEVDERLSPARKGLVL